MHKGPFAYAEYGFKISTEGSPASLKRPGTNRGKNYVPGSMRSTPLGVDFKFLAFFGRSRLDVCFVLCQVQRPVTHDQTPGPADLRQKKTRKEIKQRHKCTRCFSSSGVITCSFMLLFLFECNRDEHVDIPMANFWNKCSKMAKTTSVNVEFTCRNFLIYSSVTTTFLQIPLNCHTAQNCFVNTIYCSSLNTLF